MDSNLYSSSISDNGAYSVGYAELLDRMNHIEKTLRHVHKKHKKRKRKKGSSKNKKLKKQLKTLKKQNQEMSYFIQILAVQMQAKNEPLWWQNILKKSTPKLIDFASDVVKTRHQPTVQVLPANNQLCLPDGRKKQ